MGALPTPLIRSARVLGDIPMIPKTLGHKDIRTTPIDTQGLRGARGMRRHFDL
jgi:hypothetical protein